MGAGHPGAGGLHHDGDSVVHRLAPEAKLLATLSFVLAVVCTPRDAPAAFALDAAALLGVAVAARLPARLVARRLRVGLPFLAFALLLPLVGEGPRRELGWLHLSEAGLAGAGNVLAKGGLGLLAAVVLGATTTVPDLLHGLRRLRVPAVLVAIASFMVRYLDVIVGEAGRMRTARLSRGHDPRWLWQSRAIAATAGTLFVRSYERGERVHLAMLSRGYAGTLPVTHHHHVATPSAVLAALVPLVAVGAAVAASLG